MFNKKVKNSKLQNHLIIKKSIIRKSSSTSIWQLTVSERRNAATIIQNTTIRPFIFTGSTFKCFYCSEYYSNTELLLEHTEKHNPGDMNNILDKYFPKSKRTIQADITNLKCRLCDEKHDCLSEIKEHLETKHDIMFNKDTLGIIEYKMVKKNDVFVCHLCDNNYPTFSLLNSHMNFHVGTVVCENCGAGFINQQHLKMHKDTHKKEKYDCSECDKVFNKKRQLQYHIEIMHKGKDRVRMRKCPHCNETFKEHYSKMLHLNRVHGITMEFTCYVCKKTFQKQRNLREHITRVHTEKYKCEICLKCFSMESILKHHLLSHSGERNFVCHICKNSYMHKRTLAEHMKSHSSVLKFVCLECGLGFRGKIELSKHMKQLHLGHS